MNDHARPPVDKGDCAAEITRLNKIIRALMDRAERNADLQQSEFSMLETRVRLENEVQHRTAELEKALRENEKITRSLRESEMKFRGVVSQSLVGVAMVERGRFTYSNERFNEMFGYSDNELLHVAPGELAAADDLPLLEGQMRRLLSGAAASVNFVIHGLRKDGSLRDIEIYGNVIRIDDEPVLISLNMDVTERTMTARALGVLRETLRDQSTHDALTGLYNRRYLDEYLASELILAERAGEQVTVIMGDLDHFKVVNDRFGHLGGDEVLRTFGQLMRAHARRDDVYCRYGGEEFLLVLPNVTKERAGARAEQLRAAIAARPVSYGGATIAVTASFGVATFPGDGRTGDELVGAADGALYVAKTAGRNRVEIATCQASA